MAFLPIKGVVWLAKQLMEQAERELYDVDKLRGELMELELRLDMGEITEEEYMEAEEEILARLKVAQEYQEAKE